MLRQFSRSDLFIGRLDCVLRSLHKQDLGPIQRDTQLSEQDSHHSVQLMRINHTGEVCAQALYLGQSCVAQDRALAQELQQAAEEEKAHLTWCRERIVALGGKTSIFNPFFAIGSFLIGSIAGLCGDRWSLGFLAETENQVSEHLDKHLKEISSKDITSQKIIRQMQMDEEKHAAHAIHLGGIALPKPLPQVMKVMAKVMTTLTRYL